MDPLRISGVAQLPFDLGLNVGTEALSSGLVIIRRLQRRSVNLILCSEWFNQRTVRRSNALCRRWSRHEYPETPHRQQSTMMLVFGYTAVAGMVTRHPGQGAIQPAHADSIDSGGRRYHAGRRRAQAKKCAAVDLRCDGRCLTQTPVMQRVYRRGGASMQGR